MSANFSDVFANARQIAFDRNDAVFRAGSPVLRLFLVDAGCVALERVLPGGAITTLQRARSGEVLAEASLYAETYHCDARALEPSRLRTLACGDVRRVLAADPCLAESWARHLAKTVRTLRLQSEIRSLNTVAERLDAWLGEFGELPERGDWQSIAAEISVSREALYRELSRRRRRDAANQ